MRNHLASKASVTTLLSGMVLGITIGSAAALSPADTTQRQILFESMFHNGNKSTAQQDKQPSPAPAPPAAASAPTQRRQAAPVAAMPTAAPEAKTPAPENNDTLTADEWEDVAAPAPVRAPSMHPNTPPAARPVTLPGQNPAAPVPNASPAPSANAPQNAPQPAAPAAPSSSELMRRAQAGDPQAEYQIGMLFTQDQPGRVPRTGAQNQSYHWFSQAASKGHPRAQYNLGVMYAQGDGIVQSLSEAYIWFNLAAAQQMEGALEARDMVASSLTPAALMKAQERSTLYHQQIAQNIVRMQTHGPQAIVPVR